MVCGVRELAQRAPAEDDGHGLAEGGEEVVTRVVRDDEGAVDIAAEQIAPGLLRGRGRMRELEIEHVVAVVQAVADALDDVGEVRVAEEAMRVLRHHEGDRHRGAHGEGAGGPVRDVVEFADRALDGLDDLGTHSWGVVDHP